jgi:hypothetical protein
MQIQGQSLAAQQTIRFGSQPMVSDEKYAACLKNCKKTAYFETWRT